jgi:hypothetical protein
MASRLLSKKDLRIMFGECPATLINKYLTDEVLQKIGQLRIV